MIYMVEELGSSGKIERPFLNRCQKLFKIVLLQTSSSQKFSPVLTMRVKETEISNTIDQILVRFKTCFVATW